ncbi:hypothetical protein ACSFCS_21650 [Yokenella regensburgei]
MISSSQSQDGDRCIIVVSGPAALNFCVPDGIPFIAVHLAHIDRPDISIIQTELRVFASVPFWTVASMFCIQNLSETQSISDAGPPTGLLTCLRS